MRPLYRRYNDLTPPRAAEKLAASAVGKCDADSIAQRPALVLKNGSIGAGLCLLRCNIRL
jgi:hypothetical protein